MSSGLFSSSRFAFPVALPEVGCVIHCAICSVHPILQIQGNLNFVEYTDGIRARVKFWQMHEGLVAL